METTKKYMFSIITGKVIGIEEWESKVLFNYQIPLKRLPKNSCKHCYGRGYTSQDAHKLYKICTCTQKAIVDGYDLTTVKIFLPKNV